MLYACFCLESVGSSVKILRRDVMNCSRCYTGTSLKANTMSFGNSKLETFLWLESFRKLWISIAAKELRPNNVDEQEAYDDRDREALTTIGIVVLYYFIPHVQDAKASQDDWDALKSLYEIFNELRISI